METWRPKLLASIKADNNWVQQQKQDLQKNVKDLAHKKECCNCRLLCYASDTISLLCQHAHCFDCVSDRLERLTGYLEKRNISLAILKNLMVCSRCHRPTAVSLDTLATRRIAQQDRGGRARYVVSPNATCLKSTVRSYYQNQRRSILGKFKFKALWPFERPRFTSCEAGSETKLIDLRKLEKLGSINGTREGEEVELYLEDWSFDTVDGDPLGWHYAFNWPKNESEWTYVASATTFVRRRRMYRASITLRMGKGEDMLDYMGGGGGQTSNPYTSASNRNMSSPQHTSAHYGSSLRM